MINYYLKCNDYIIHDYCSNQFTYCHLKRLLTCFTYYTSNGQIDYIHDWAIIYYVIYWENRKYDYNSTFKGTSSYDFGDTIEIIDYNEITITITFYTSMYLGCIAYKLHFNTLQLFHLLVFRHFLMNTKALLLRHISQIRLLGYQHF